MRTTRSYHHGNLKYALLKASTELIRKTGAANFTLREVARRAGVSHNAPYRHFRSKAELLAALAAAGFDRLTAAMTRAAENAAGTLERFRACGRGYVEFALRYPEHFAVMFEMPRLRVAFPQTQAAGKRAFATLVDCVKACQTASLLPAGDSLHYTLLAWSMVHGVAKLAIGGRLPIAGIAEVLRFTDAAIDALWMGLASTAASRPDLARRA